MKDVGLNSGAATLGMNGAEEVCTVAATTCWDQSLFLGGATFTTGAGSVLKASAVKVEAAGAAKA